MECPYQFQINQCKSKAVESHNYFYLNLFFENQDFIYSTKILYQKLDKFDANYLCIKSTNIAIKCNLNVCLWLFHSSIVTP